MDEQKLSRLGFTGKSCQGCGYWPRTVTGPAWCWCKRAGHVRDVAMGEDASQVRSGSAPQVMAALRNTVLAILLGAGATNIAAALRQVGWTQGAALPFLSLHAP